MKRRLALAGTAMVWVSIGMVASGMDAAAKKTPYGTMETYRQVVVVKTRPGADTVPPPQLARVYNGHKWGLSTRWDDSNANALNVRGKMLENGIRGTFYLNSRKPEKQAGSLAQKLTGAGECSVGGHSVSHPHLPKLPANQAFYELMANRIAIESLTDRPVNSLAFPFGGYKDSGRPEVLQGITEAFLRTGYHHCVYSQFVTQNPHLPADLVSTGLQVVPGDRQVNPEKFWASIEKINTFESKYRETSDCIFLGVHPWQKDQELENLATLMSKLRDWDDFWHCTQTEYAAFTKQHRGTTVNMLKPGVFALQRPCAFELGNDIPLTLAFEGEAVLAADVDGVACPTRQANGKTFVNVPHAPQFGLPTQIDQAQAGISTKFPGLKTSLTFDSQSGKATYTLENTTDVPLTDALVTLSVPPAFEPGVLRWKRAELASKAIWSAQGSVAESRTGEHWQKGKRYVAAQLDFVLNGERGRLFTTCTVDIEVAAR